MTLNRTIRAVFLLALSLATFLPFIGQRDVVTSHEARTIQVARQMAAVGWPWEGKKIDVPQVEIVHLPEGERLRGKTNGETMPVNPWIVPVYNGEIRLQKPPLPYWCSAILFRIFGLGEGVSRFVPALLGALAVLVVWDLAKKLLGHVGAWYAALVWVSSYFMVDEFRKAMADPYLAFFTLTAIWAWVSARKNSVGCLIVFYASLALGVLAKGPIIFIFVGVILPVYHFCYRKKLPGSWMEHLLGIVVFLLIGLPWVVIVYKSVPHALELWRYESVGELSDNTEKARGWWYYLPNLLLISLPWTPIWLMGLIFPLKFFRRRDSGVAGEIARRSIAPEVRYRTPLLARFSNRRRTFGLIVSFIIVILFSLSWVKKNTYLLPMMPIEAIVVAQGLVWLTIIFRPNPKHRPMKVPMMRTAVLAIIFSIAVQVLETQALAKIDNERSPKHACELVMQMLAGSPNRSLLVSQLPEEAAVYLPLGMHDSKNPNEVLVIADDRKGQAEATIKSITPAYQEIALKSSRWRIYSFTAATATSDPAR